jgi:hypothetical protein
MVTRARPMEFLNVDTSPVFTDPQNDVLIRPDQVLGAR